MTSSVTTRAFVGLVCGAFFACGNGVDAESPHDVAMAGSGGAASGSAPRQTGGAAAGTAGSVAQPPAGASGSLAGADSPAAGGTLGSAGAGLGGGGGTSAGGASAGTAGTGASTAGTGAGGVGAVCMGAPAQVATVYMIGDSTMSVYASNLFPRMGWGQPLGASFGPACATVNDKALSGRSSKSFFDEGAWTPVKNALKAGDYVLIQFAHNDEKSDDPTRYTQPQTTYKQFLTTYVNDTRAKQATPLLLTPINRNNWSGATVSNSHGLYPDAVRELAASLKVELIDLTALTKAYFERIGRAETDKLFLILAAGQSPNYPDGVTDNTHLQERGALVIGQLAMADAYNQKLPLARWLKAVPVAP
ncbi:MAG TPA: rhamnogalacturonan acetylesterase [Polyangiaceae bacterium]|nr:rhamnogalacturonan acetylesterase [Polyangiaceae bacterium]